MVCDGACVCVCLWVPLSGAVMVRGDTADRQACRQYVYVCMNRVDSSDTPAKATEEERRRTYKKIETGGRREGGERRTRTHTQKLVFYLNFFRLKTD